MSRGRISVTRSEDNELFGFVAESTSGSWEAQTVFGYTIEHTESQAKAEAIVRQQGLKFLTGVWQYYDKQDDGWYPCIIKEANQVNVTVVRTNVMGYQDPSTYKLVVIESPDDTNLIKAY